MHVLLDWFHKLYDFKSLIEWGGYAVLAAIIFSETGLLVGFFLPGDSLLVTAGVLAATGLLNLLYLNVLLVTMAIVGDAVGYHIGKKAGSALFKREESFFFRPSHLIATQKFYDRHGGKTIIMARFMPFARTFAPVVAGIAQMPYRRFAMFNIVGGAGWVVSMTVLGYVLGRSVNPKSIERIVYLIIVVSVLPVVIEVLRNRRRAPEPTPVSSESGQSGS